MAKAKAPPETPPNGPRPRGRPPADEQGSSVSTWLTHGEHDLLIRLANKHELSISATVRQLLLLKLR